MKTHFCSIWPKGKSHYPLLKFRTKIGWQRRRQLRGHTNGQIFIFFFFFGNPFVDLPIADDSDKGYFWRRLTRNYSNVQWIDRLRPNSGRLRHQGLLFPHHSRSSPPAPPRTRPSHLPPLRQTCCIGNFLIPLPNLFSDLNRNNVLWSFRCLWEPWKFHHSSLFVCL